MSVRYAIDFGTTNTVIASDRGGSVAPVLLPGLCAERTGTPVVPSAVCFREAGGEPFTGKPAVEQNGLGRSPAFAQGFKRHLGRESGRGVARLNGSEITARRCGEAFFAGLRQALRAQDRPRRRPPAGWWDDLCEWRSPLLGDLTLTNPVDADEQYRRELAALGRQLGARTPRLVDEPVAAALGYGVNVGRELVVLVLDWGGGTLDVSIVRTGPKTLAEGRATVLAKSGVPLGGDDVDRWIVGKYLFPIEQFVMDWEVDALWRAAEAKEAASLHGGGYFHFRDRPPRQLSREGLEALMEEHGAYQMLERALDECLGHLHSRHGLLASAIDEALLVGGSTYLPGVEERLRERVPQARLGEWNPFAAVATGACEFARGGRVEDLVYHDYALRLAEADGRTVYYELLVPANSSYPSRSPVERTYLPDPGSPEEIVFEVCEIARLGHGPVEWQMEASGRRTWRPATQAEHLRAGVINEGDTELRLPPSPRNPRRLQVSYRIDDERFLRWTVQDGERLLKDNAPLGRLR